MCLYEQKREHILESMKCTSVRNLGLVSAAHNYNQSTTCARQAPCTTRLRIKPFKRPQRLAAKTSIYPKIFIFRFGRSFRNSFNKTNCQICQLEARYHTDAFILNWCNVKGYAFLPFSLITKVLILFRGVFHHRIPGVWQICLP